MADEDDPNNYHNKYIIQNDERKNNNINYNSRRTKAKNRTTTVTSVDCLDAIIKNSPKKQTQKTHQKQNKNSNGQESWGRDSGARDLDLSPERLPNSNSISTDSHIHMNENELTMFDVTSKFHVAALSALNNEVLELKSCLEKSDFEKETLKRQLKDAFEEKERSQRRLEAVSASNESRLTEMHCVIVELNKKLKAQQDHAIMEEQEPDGSVSELSFQEGSIYNSEMEGMNYDQEKSNEQIDIILTQQKSSSPYSMPLEFQPPNQSISANQQVSLLQEEVLHLRAQIALLQSQLANRENMNYCEDNDDYIIASGLEPGEEEEEDCPDYDDVNSIHEKSNYTSDDLCETADIYDVTKNDHIKLHKDDLDESEFSKLAKAECKKTSSMAISPSKCISPVNRLVLENSIGSLNQSQYKKSSLPIAKMAERVKLRRTVEDKHITGSDISNNGIHSTEMAEHLVSDMLQPETSAPADSDTISSQSLQNEVQRLQRRVEHLKVQNSVISLTLTESKQHCDQLYLLCGKYESNAIALQQALNCSDRAIEAYDVMLALLESKLGILENTNSAEESRRAAETVARHLLKRLECENENIQENSLGPWQGALLIYPDSANSDYQKAWDEDDDISLRCHVSKLKGQRSLIQNTVVVLESPFNLNNNKDDTGSPTNGTCGRGRSKHESRRMDLETAVLMQELMSMREDVSELKFRADTAEREKLLAKQRLATLQEALVHLQAQLAESETLLAMATNRTSYSESEHVVCIERELVEALARESRLKARLQGLAGSLETATRTSEERHTQVQKTVNEMKQHNFTLSQSLERCKRKYQTRLRKLEQQLLGMSLNTKTTQGAVSQQQMQSSKQQFEDIVVPVPETTL